MRNIGNKLLLLLLLLLLVVVVVVVVVKLPEVFAISQIMIYLPGTGLDSGETSIDGLGRSVD